MSQPLSFCCRKINQEKQLLVSCVVLSGLGSLHCSVFNTVLESRVLEIILLGLWDKMSGFRCWIFMHLATRGKSSYTLYCFPKLTQRRSTHPQTHIHEIMLHLFSSSRSLLPPPHIWTIGRTRFLCAATWAREFSKVGQLPPCESDHCSFFFFAELCFNPFKACMYACMPVTSVGGATQRLHNVCVYVVRLMLKMCTGVWIVELNMFADQIYCCWKCPWGLEDVEVWGGPRPTLLLMRSQHIRRGGSWGADISPFSTARRKQLIIYPKPQKLHSKKVFPQRHTFTGKAVGAAQNNLVKNLKKLHTFSR